MREAFYIDMERREVAKKEWEEEKLYADDDFDYKGQPSGFEIQYPARECKPITRTRTRQQVRKMINRAI